MAKGLLTSHHPGRPGTRMTHSSRIHKKISGKHLLWFYESNRWIVFEKPAYKVYKLHKKGLSPSSIQADISKKYKISSKDSLRFTREIIDGILHAEIPLDLPENKPFKTNSKLKKPEAFFSQRTYLIKDKRIEISYGDKLIEYYLHPPMAYMETGYGGNPDITYSLYETGSEYVLNSTPKEKCDSFTNISQLKRSLTLNILNLIYNAADKDWFSRVHASVVGNDKSAIILSSPSGSGKSTLAALLQHSGLRVLSDDLAPIMKQNMVYPVPAALSIKKGAFELVNNYFPHSDFQSSKMYSYGSKELSFLPPHEENQLAFIPLPAKALVFVSYEKEAKTAFNKLPILEALRRYHEEAWVDRSYENASQFINWFETLSCFELRYSDTKSALEIISKLISEI